MLCNLTVAVDNSTRVDWSMVGWQVIDRPPPDAPGTSETKRVMTWAGDRSVTNGFMLDARDVQHGERRTVRKVVRTLLAQKLTTMWVPKAFHEPKVRTKNTTYLYAAIPLY